jgi:hypothetical protein
MTSDECGWIPIHLTVITSSIEAVIGLVAPSFTARIKPLIGAMIHLRRWEYLASTDLG